MTMNNEFLKDMDVICEDVPASKSKRKVKSSSDDTKKNFEALMKPVGVLDCEPAIRKMFEKYSCTQLETVTGRIKQCVYNIASNFIEIGFRLWECDRYGYYKEAGFENVCDYAFAELGFKKSSTRNFINVYERFFKSDYIKNVSHKSDYGGHAVGNFLILNEYKNFSYSQLTELLSLSDEQIKTIAPTPKSTVKQIRDKKRELYEAAEQWLKDSIISAVGGKLGFKKQIYEFYTDNISENNVIGKLATFIKDHILKIKSDKVIFDDGSYCRFELSSVIFFHSLYYPDDKVMRWYDIAEKIVGYIEAGDFLSEQISFDEIVPPVEVHQSELRADVERPYKIELYKDDIEVILSSLRAANVPQDTYDRIYETIGKADIT